MRKSIQQISKVTQLVVLGVFIATSAFASSGNFYFGNNSRRPYMPLAIGQNHGCVIKANPSTPASSYSAAYCWGDNTYGQLGIGTTGGTVSTPTSIYTGSWFGAPQLVIGAGATHTCALSADGSVWCWGNNPNGELGNGTTTSSNIPVATTSASSSSVSLRGATLSVGAYHSCIVQVGGGVRCWGKNSSGQLGVGSTTNSNYARSVSFASVGNAPVVDVAAGNQHTCALLGNGLVSCWGDNTYGQLGDGTTTSRTSPTTLALLGGGYAISIASAGDHTCALLGGGGVLCWGLNSAGQLGNATTTNASTPVTVVGTGGSGSLNNIVSIGTGIKSSCAVDAQGSTYCWGDNTYGQVGDGTTTTRTYPVNITSQGSLSTGGGGLLISSGLFHTCTLTPKGSLQCWGDNSKGQLGNGTTTSSSVPVASLIATGSVNTLAQASIGTVHGCGITPSGTLKCWGWNMTGAVGDGGTTDESTPVSITLNATPIQVSSSSGGDHTCALMYGGSVSCWGANWLGQIGNGAFIPGASSVLSPSNVSGLTKIVAIATGTDTSYALRSDGVVYGWGSNLSSEVDGISSSSTSAYSTPQQISLPAAAIALSAGSGFACALLVDRSVACWGDNSDGQLGRGSASGTHRPGFSAARTTSFSGSALALSSGESASCVLIGDGSVQCWGLNSDSHGSATLGVGLMGPVTIPTTVIGTDVNPGIALFWNGSAGILHSLGAGGCSWGSNGGAMYVWGTERSGSLGGGSSALYSTPVPRTLCWSSTAGNFQEFGIRMLGLGALAGTVQYDGRILLRGQSDGPAFGMGYPSSTPVGYSGDGGLVSSFP